MVLISVCLVNVFLAMLTEQAHNLLMKAKSPDQRANVDRRKERISAPIACGQVEADIMSGFAFGLRHFFGASFDVALD
jgi:hypothetical protein